MLIVASSEMEENAVIKSDNDELNATQSADLGCIPLTFSFNVTGACIPVPNITISLQMDEVAKCANSFTCSSAIKSPGQIYVTVKTPYYEKKFPGKDGFYHTQGKKLYP